MNKLLCFILCAACMASASLLGIDALGEEQVLGGMVNAAGRGFAGGAKTGDAEGVSVVNPARIAFDTKVVFNLNFFIDMTTAESDESTYSTTNISLPSFNFSFPMGSLGAVGLSLWQHYASNMDEDVSDSASGMDAAVKYQGSVYEIIPTYAVRVPFFRMMSLGASAHFVMGNVERSLTLGPDNSGVGESDAWATNSSEVTDYASGTWEIKNHPAYYTLSMQFRGRQSSYYFSYTTPYVLKNDLSYDFRFSQLDTLIPTRYTREVEIPALLATGVNYRLFKRHNVMMDLQWRAWDSDVENVAGGWDMSSVTKTQNDFMVSLGYQRDGSPLFYDSYLDRTTFRFGGWMKSWYVKDVYEYGGSIGAGLPMGKKGTMIDLALQGGKRTTGGHGDWEELFFGIRLGLMGVGTWGQSRGR
ncbi:MAG: hypothetical protein J6U20_07645 [Fibrobacter sp.]|nr:hypothetical protein [Fibrobacter sp.]